MTDPQHVIPLNDLREHVANPGCWCRPTQCDDQPLVWLHHSMDGREAFEEGRRRVS